MIHILDASNYIYAGLAYTKYMSVDVIEVAGYYQDGVVPISGVRFLFKEYMKLIANGDRAIIAFDSTPTIKYELSKKLYFGERNYKENRIGSHKNPNISFTKFFARQIADRLNIPYMYEEGYEADDLIAAFVTKYKHDFDEVAIHTKDGDLAYLVDDNVHIDYVGTKGKYIDKTNYSTEAGPKGSILPYNAAPIYKIINGDTGDNIPETRYDQYHVWNWFLNNPEYLSGDYTIVWEGIEKALEEVGHSQYLPAYEKTYKMVKPLDVDILSDLHFYDDLTNPDLETLENVYISGTFLEGPEKEFLTEMAILYANE